MSVWRIRQRYGFGAAQIRLGAPAHRPHPSGLIEGLRLAARELRFEGWRRLGLSLARRMLLASFAVWTVLVMLAVILARPLPTPETFAPTQIQLLPLDPPPELVAQPATPPLTRRPELVAQPATPPLTRRPEPEPALEARPRPRPVVRIDPLAARPPEPTSQPVARFEARPLATASPHPAVRPDAVASLPAFPRQPRLLSRDAALPGTPLVRDRRFDPGALALPSVSAAAVDLPAQPSRFALGSRAAALGGVARRAIPRPEPPAAQAAVTGSIEGVALASLPSCRSDADEDSLKRELLAAVEVQVECNSHAGTYRFLETRNLNAFLMWVERTPWRRKGNRCDELRFALACLRDREG